MKKSILFVSLFLYVINSVISQDYKLNSYIIKAKSNEAIHKLVSNTISDHSLDNSIYIKTLFKDAQLYELNTTHLKQYEQDILQALQKNSDIYFFNKNAKVKYRNTPNDPEYPEQVSLGLIEADAVWNTTTGGLTEDGDEIVVAILDDGFDVTHKDLKNNTWFNKGEIPNDLIDNDNNGYIDDYYGLNVNTGNDKHPQHYHGIGVAGIIGAEGDNNIGVTGINWDIKMMLISQADYLDEIITAYDYVYNQRKLYNETNGSEGGFIVATNFSAGIDGGQPDSFPTWCEIYDKLGEVGIINIVATTNKDVNVDQDGDMPSTCPSEYMISVTNTTHEDIFDNSGTGKIHVDMAAPGSGSYTTYLNNGYRTFGGTSASTPHVTGAVALLYSIACKKILEEKFTNPAKVARIFRDAILEGGDDLEELTDITATGKRLNIYGSSKQLGTYCGTTPDGELNILSIKGYQNTDDGIAIDYITNTSNVHEIIIVDVQGRLVYRENFTPSFFENRSITIPSKILIPGTYFVSILDGNKKASKTLAIIY